MTASLRREFFSWGYALPLLLPLAQLLGKAVFHWLGALYLLWALLALGRDLMRVPRVLILAFAVLFGAYAASLFAATDPLAGLRRLSEVIGFGLVAFFTAGALTAHPDPRAAYRRLLTIGGGSALLVLLLLYKNWWLDVSLADFMPQTKMKEDNLPLLTPLLLCLTWYAPQRWRAPLVIVLLAAVTVYVAASYGRAALLGLLATLGLYCLLVWRFSALKMLLLVAALFVGIVGWRGAELFHVQREASLSQQLAQLTTYRSVLWTQALHTPPPNVLLGVGLDNLGRGDAVLQIPLGTGADGKTIYERVEHLHNFILDCWYETGLLGLSAMLFWLGTLLRAAWRKARDAHYPLAGVCFASAGAILVSALFSFSYASKQFALYLPLFLILAAYAPPAAADDRAR